VIDWNKGKEFHTIMRAIETGRIKGRSGVKQNIYSRVWKRWKREGEKWRVEKNALWEKARALLEQWNQIPREQWPPPDPSDPVVWCAWLQLISNHHEQHHAGKERPCELGPACAELRNVVQQLVDDMARDGICPPGCRIVEQIVVEDATE
jgi:hypothetical protein